MRNLRALGVLVIGVSCAGAGKSPPEIKANGARVPKPAGEGSARAPLEVGDAVFGQWTDGEWYPGKIAAINSDGTYAVNYDDGDVSLSLSVNQVRRPPTITIPKVEPAMPDTPAGKTLRAWLEAFNSSDEARGQAFAELYKHRLDRGFQKQTGGFHLLSIEKSAPFEITFVVKEKASATTAVGWLRLTRAEPFEIESLQVLAIPFGKTAADMDPKLEVATRTRVLDGIVAKLDELYVYPDTAKKMAQALREHQKRGVYDAVTESRAFAALVTEQLRAVSRDKHLRVEFMVRALPAEDPKEPSAADKETMRAQLERMNCGFEKAERIDGNIGYVKFNMFAEAELCGPKVNELMGTLGDVDALIFDLRDNGGGHPDMVAFVSSYLFAKRTHLNDIYSRKENKTTQYWTKPEVSGKKYATQPVYVLTSNRTFSGAEEFSYNLKSLKRATIIGETTGGGAHPTMGIRIDDHFMIGVPFARAINPITKTNWEGTGVEPDVRVPAAQALETAKNLAVEKIDQLKKKQPRKK